MNKLEEISIIKQLESCKDKKIAFWGASCFLLEFLNKNNIDKYNIIGILDNNPNINGSIFLKYKIFKPDIIKEKPDFIIFTIKNNNSNIYEAIKISTNNLFPDAKLLPNIFDTHETNLSETNKIYLIDEHGKKTQINNIAGLDIRFMGTNSIVEIEANPLPVFKNCCIKCYDNSFVHINSSKFEFKNLYVYLTGRLIIGKDFSVNGAHFVITKKPEQTLKIGDNCMFSRGILIRTSDAHSLYHNEKKELLNPDSDIEIGNHVWVGQDVTILKNTKIGNNCVIGAGSLVNKNFIENNVVIAGNPAKIVKYDINWDRAIPSNFN